MKVLDLASAGATVPFAGVTRCRLFHTCRSPTGARLQRAIER